MIDSYKKLDNYLQIFDCGDTVHNIVSGWGGTEVALKQSDWPAKEEMSNGNWLERCLKQSMRRVYDVEAKKMVLRDKDVILKDGLRNLRSAIKDVAEAVNPAEQPKRTKAYKEMIELAYAHEFNESWVDDVLPIVNYYYDTKADSTNNKTHCKNIYSLFNILRKKYGNTSS